MNLRLGPLVILLLILLALTAGARAGDDTAPAMSDPGASAAPATPATAAPVERKADRPAGLRGVSPRGDDVLHVVVHSARDCGYCAAWKRDPGGLGNAKLIAAARPQVRLQIVERHALREPELASDYPADLRFAYERRVASNQLQPGVPVFELFLNEQLLYRGVGQQAWSDDMQPAILDLEKKRDRNIAAAAPK